MKSTELAAPEAAVARPPMGAIYGGGRSGTSWLGTMVSCHPDVTYRFEPLHRGGDDADIERLITSMRSNTFGPTELQDLYKVLLKATPRTYRPPYIAEPAGAIPDVLRAPIRLVADKMPLGERVFGRLFTPSPGTHLIYKEVDRAGELAAMTRSGMPIAYLVRNPCAVVRSRVEGQERGIMALAGRRANLATVIAHNPSLVDEYGDRLDDLTIHEAEALIWRADLERIIPHVDAAPNADVYFYEDLVDRPHEVGAAVLGTLELDMAQPIVDFIDASSSPATRKQRIAYGEFGRLTYFSVFQDPAASRDSWRGKLSADEQRQIVDIVVDSPIVQRGMELDIWDLR